MTAVMKPPAETIMTQDAHTHSITIALNEPAPSEVAVGDDFVLKLKVSCPAGCDLSGTPLTATDPDGRATVSAADAPDQGGAETRDLALRAPLRVGEQTWSLRLGPHESAGALHAETTLPVRVRIKPHATSLAVWAVPAPVVMGERFRIKVGAKSSAACALAGRKILISDPAGVVIGEGNLGEAPWPGTSALYWTEVELAAPAREGLFWCVASFAAHEVETPHEGTSSRFSVAVVRPPEHRLTVKVLEKDTHAPVEDAQVRLGPYGAATDPSGQAEVAMPKGTFDLTVWKVGYEAPSLTVEVQDDVTIRVEAVIVPPENPDAAWLM
jgi:hypothetical protein